MSSKKKLLEEFSDVIPSGKFAGKTVQEAMEENPTYLLSYTYKDWEISEGLLESIYELINPEEDVDSDL